MSLRRPLGLLAVLLVLLATALVLEHLRPSGPQATPLLGLRADDVIGLRIKQGARELRAVRRADAWHSEVPSVARPGAPVAVGAMVDALVTLVPLDAFARPGLDLRALGLDPERARIEIEVLGSAEPIVLRIGDYAPSGGSVYGMLGSDGPIYRIGALIMSEVEKVFYRVYRVLPEEAGGETEQPR